MNWNTSIENFKNYLKLERGLSMNSIKSYEFDLFEFKNFIIENDINESPKKCSSSTVKRYLYKNLSNKMYKHFGKINLKDYIKNFIKNN